MNAPLNRIQIPLARLRWLAPLSLSLALAAPAAPNPCSTSNHELSVPDPATLKLADGVHTIASLKSPSGKLEVRVRVKGKEISANEFFVDGRRLKKVKESDLPKELLGCLKEKRAALSSGGLIEAAAWMLSDWIEHEAEAKAPVCVMKVTWTCYNLGGGKYWCVYRICQCNECELFFDDVR